MHALSKLMEVLLLSPFSYSNTYHKHVSSFLSSFSAYIFKKAVRRTVAPRMREKLAFESVPSITNSIKSLGSVDTVCARKEFW